MANKAKFSIGFGVEGTKKAAQDFSNSLGKAVDTAVTTVKGLMPWQEAQGANTNIELDSIPPRRAHWARPPLSSS